MQAKSWWDDDDVGHALHAYVTTTEAEQSYRQALMLHYASMYMGTQLQGLSAQEYGYEPTPIEAEPLSFNLCASQVDTAVSKLSKVQPRPQFMSIGADWELQQKTKDLEKFVAGKNYEGGFYGVLKQVVKNAAVFGSGFILPYRSGKDIRFESIFPWEMHAKDAEAMYGEPRCVARKKYVERQRAMELWPEKASELEALGSEAATFMTASADQIVVWEAWRLGHRHVIESNGIVLLDEPWEKETFPWVHLTWESPLIGWFGYGIGRLVSGYQNEIGAVLRAMRTAIRASVPRIFLPKGSGVQKSDLDDQVGAILEYSGNPPMFSAPNAFSGSWMQWLQLLDEHAHFDTGLSQLAVRSEKPPGVDSGVALRRFNDIQSERLLDVGQKIEQVAIECAKRTIQLQREINDEFGVQKGKWYDDKGRVQGVVDWIDLDDEEYSVQCYPVSELSATFAGKTEDVTWLMQNGMIGPEEARRLMRIPDTEASSELADAAWTFANWQIDGILELGEQAVVDPQQDLELTLQLGVRRYLLASRKGCPDENLALMREFLVQVQDMMPGPEPEAGPGPMPEPPGLEQAPMEMSQ